METQWPKIDILRTLFPSSTTTIASFYLFFAQLNTFIDLSAYIHIWLVRLKRIHIPSTYELSALLEQISPSSIARFFLLKAEKCPPTQSADFFLPPVTLLRFHSLRSEGAVERNQMKHNRAKAPRRCYTCCVHFSRPQQRGEMNGNEESLEVSFSSLALPIDLRWWFMAAGKFIQRRLILLVFSRHGKASEIKTVRANKHEKVSRAAIKFSPLSHWLYHYSSSEQKFFIIHCAHPSQVAWSRSLMKMTTLKVGKSSNLFN